MTIASAGITQATPPSKSASSTCLEFVSPCLTVTRGIKSRRIKSMLIFCVVFKLFPPFFAAIAQTKGKGNFFNCLWKAPLDKPSFSILAKKRAFVALLRATGLVWG